MKRRSLKKIVRNILRAIRLEKPYLFLFDVLDLESKEYMVQTLNKSLEEFGKILAQYNASLEIPSASDEKLSKAELMNLVKLFKNKLKILKKQNHRFQEYKRFLELVGNLMTRIPNNLHSVANYNFADLSATPATRSVAFYHNSYYHNYYLAQALRKRGWDAVSVSLEDPNGINRFYYHGEDINLYDNDPANFRENIQSFFEVIKQKYKMVHFSNDGVLSLFPEYYGDPEPADIIELRNKNIIIANAISGCSSGVRQSSVYNWSTKAENGLGVCDTCIWQDNPQVCSDERNAVWGKKLEKYCDVIFAGNSPALDFLTMPKVIRDPLTAALDPIMWNPSLAIPEEDLIPKAPGEILIYHAVGNYKLRTKSNGRNMKGTSAVYAAIEQLQAEGYPVRLIFVTNKKNVDVRFIQVQADIIIDQLNYGRYGAMARESMMLGKPTISYVNPYEISDAFRLPSIMELPLISADERTLYQVLKDLVLNEEKRQRIGQASRNYALKWHSADACAERYEQIFDQLVRGEFPKHPTEWTYYDPVPHKVASMDRASTFQLSQSEWEAYRMGIDIQIHRESTSV